MTESISPDVRSRFEQVIRGLCLGILLVSGLWSWALLTGSAGLGASRLGLIAGALQLLMLAWAWLYRWGREGVRWQFGCGYVGFVVLAFNLYAQVFLGGGTWLLTMIGGAGVIYGLVPMVRRSTDDDVERTPATSPSPVAATESAEARRRPDALELTFQAQALALIVMIGWGLLVLTRLEEFVTFMSRPAGKVIAAYLWMVIGGFWWFSMGRRGITAKSFLAAVASAFMAGNLYAEAFLRGGSWVVTLLAFLVNVAALMQWLPNRGMDALPRSPGLDDAPPAPADAGHGHH